MTPDEVSPGLRPPPALALSAALLLWGWQAGVPAVGLGAAALLELPRLLRFRLAPGQDDFNRLWNFTMLLFVGVGLYLFLAREGISTVNTVVSTGSAAARMQGLRQISSTALTFLRWLPLVLLPFTAACVWSHTVGLPWATFSFYLRQKHAATPGAPRLHTARVNPLWPYLALTLFAAGATTEHGTEFLPLVTGVIAWSLWPWRNRRFAAPVWAGLVVLLVASSFAAGPALSLVRRLWHDWENRLLQNSDGAEFDQLKSFTSIGSVGRLKQSGRIILRVRPMPGEDPPQLLREAAFNRFRPYVWGTGHRDFQAVLASSEDGLSWLSTNHQAAVTAMISRYSSKGEAPLPLPIAAVGVHNLYAVLETNHLGSARVKGASPLVVCTVQYGSEGDFAALPEEDDVSLAQLPLAERTVIDQLASELGLTAMSPEEAIAAVRQHFADGFEYSLWQSDVMESEGSCVLEAFLREWRAGHCEYFATATALLLRKANVPTRYAVGFAVREPRGKEWAVRARDAHAWCLAWTGDHWEEVDTTPGVWHEVESSHAPWWQGVRDRFSDWWYQFARWRQEGGNWQIYVFAGSMIVLTWLGWRQLRGSRWRRAQRLEARAATSIERPGLDSEFYAVVHRLEAVHGPRPPHETFPAWLRCLQLAGQRGGNGLDEMLHLHMRLRFDPHGLPPAQRERLDHLARGWLARTGRG